jgi:uncharacterized protein
MSQIIVLILIGCVSGVINALAGGGAILIFPALLYFGLSSVSATATISLAVLPGLIGAIAGYRKELTQVPKSFILLVIPCLIGAVFGASLLYNIDPKVFDAIIPWLVLSSAVLLATQAKIHKLIVTEKRLVKTNKRLGFPLMILSVTVLSVYGGFFGVGVGLMLLAVVGLSSQIKNTYQLSALKSLYVSVMATTSCIYFVSSGLLNVRYGLTIAVGSAFGGYFGARYSKKISSHMVHNITVVLSFLIVLYLFLR